MKEQNEIMSVCELESHLLLLLISRGLNYPLDTHKINQREQADWPAQVIQLDCRACLRAVNTCADFTCLSVCLSVWPVGLMAAPSEPFNESLAALNNESQLSHHYDYYYHHHHHRRRRVTQLKAKARYAIAMWPQRWGEI